MHIVCPHCTTSYAINPATLGAGRAHRPLFPLQARSGWRGRRTRSEWPSPAAASPGATSPPAPMLRRRMGGDGRRRTTTRTPVVDSPSISADWPAEGDDAGRLAGDGRGGRRRPCRRRRRRPEPAPLPPALVPACSGCPPCPGSLHAGASAPADHLRRDGRADHRAVGLAQRRGAPAAADRAVLQDGRAGREPARPGLQGHQDHQRDRGRQAGAW